MSKCQFCGKGAQVGNLVSHAKNRTKRLFRPNIHKLKVTYNGQSLRVAFCAKCIKRLHRDGILGNYTEIKYQPPAEKKAKQIKAKEEKMTKTQESAAKIKKVPKQKISKKEETPKPSMSIEDIVGKKN